MGECALSGDELGALVEEAAAEVKAKFNVNGFYDAIVHDPAAHDILVSTSLYKSGDPKLMPRQQALAYFGFISTCAKNAEGRGLPPEVAREGAINALRKLNYAACQSTSMLPTLWERAFNDHCRAYLKSVSPELPESREPAAPANPKVNPIQHFISVVGKYVLSK
jgi:hypothetical protein